MLSTILDKYLLLGLTFINDFGCFFVGHMIRTRFRIGQNGGRTEGQSFRLSIMDKNQYLSTSNRPEAL